MSKQLKQKILEMLASEDYNLHDIAQMLIDDYGYSPKAALSYVRNM